MKSLVEYLSEIKDPRKARGVRHEQLSILVIMVMAMMCGHTGIRAISRFAKSHEADLAEHIPLPRNRAPSYSTFQRLVHQLDFKQVCLKFNEWMSEYRKGEAIDGKSIRSTLLDKHSDSQNFVSLVSLYGQKSGLVRRVGSLENKKESEIPVVQELLRELDVKHSVFTLDVLHIVFQINNLRGLRT